MMLSSRRVSSAERLYVTIAIVAVAGSNGCPSAGGCTVEAVASSEGDGEEEGSDMAQRLYRGASAPTV
ncbi:hypothetical protein GCM10010462_27130 [Microbacterium dextranolyticum]|uniref:Uncharacterized protein n=1 Tax=Microbacterium dextranolyticum TaxID=36806 RepID=A0A9W6HP60_9MICO|nr:hypothetical protein GCM10017591_24950 [Microbacterium dextranolyticum]